MANLPKEMKFVLIQGSLRKGSRTALIINEIAKKLEKKGFSFNIIDLTQLNMEFCDGRPLEQYNEDLQGAYQVLKSAHGYIIGMPVYQYSVSGPLKNFLDIVSGAMKGKPFGVVCTSGGVRSYLASADLMKILSFEASAIPLQPTVHTYKADFEGEKIINEKIHEKIDALLENLIKLAPITSP